MALKIENRPTENRLAAVVTGYEKHRKTKGKVNYRIIAITVVAVVAAVVIVFTAMQGSTVYYQNVSEVTKEIAAGKLPDAATRINGKVLTGSITYNTDHSQVSFTEVDLQNPSDSIKVTYSGIVPDTFKDDAQVVVTGTFNHNNTVGFSNSNVFVASEMLAKCPSKYQATSGNS